VDVEDGALEDGDSLIELTIESIRVSLMNYQRVVILREKQSDRYLCIWIGPAEADAIAVQLQEVAVARPLTHDLLRAVIDQLGAQVIHILVNDLANDTFYAKIVLDVNGTSMEVDARPSDAIALAVRAKVPIFADESVLERAGVLLDKDGETVERLERMKVDPEEIEKMSAFKDFIEGLDLDDFDKRAKGPSS
jgi:bifunctional DNase/RNase